MCNLLYVPGTGNIFDARLIVVLDYPSAEARDLGLPLTLKEKSQIEQRLANHGINPESIYYTTVVKVCPPKGREPTRKEVKSWTTSLAYEIKRVERASKRKVALWALGNGAKQAISKNKSLHNRTIYSKSLQELKKTGASHQNEFDFRAETQYIIDILKELRQ